MLAFGGHVTGFQFINYFARNADNIMLGNTWGKVPLGMYTRAYSLMMLPASKLMSPLDQVLVPVLSRLVDDPAKYRQFYCHALALVATLSTFATVGLVLTSPELIPLVLGEKWSGIVPLFLMLSPAVLVACTNSASSWLYLSFGHVDRHLFAGTINAAYMVLAMIIGLPCSSVMSGLYRYIFINASRSVRNDKPLYGIGTLLVPRFLTQKNHRNNYTANKPSCRVENSSTTYAKTLTNSNCSRRQRRHLQRYHTS